MHQIILCSRCWKFLGGQSFPSFSVSAILQQNYYDLLKVDKKAEHAEIKAAYIELSKTLHPDKNPDNPYQHEEFVKINKAYEVLSKPLSRRDYDQTLITGRPISTQTRVYKNDSRDPYCASAGTGTGWYQDFAHASAENPEGASDYYGIKGVNRVGNKSVMYGCIAVVFVSGVIIFSIFKQGSKYTIQRLDAKDQKIAAMYNEAKSTLRKNGNRKQLEVMRQRHQEFQKRRAADMNSQK